MKHSVTRLLPAVLALVFGLSGPLSGVSLVDSDLVESGQKVLPRDRLPQQGAGSQRQDQFYSSAASITSSR